MKIISKTLIIAVFTVMCIAFVSCEDYDNDTNLVENTSVSEVSDLNASQSDGLIHSKTNRYKNLRTTPSGWVDQGTNTDGGIRKYYKSSKEWYVIKVYLPEIRIKPIYRISSGSNTTNPTFQKKSVKSWRFDSKGSGADVLINASFYNMDNSLSHIFNGYGALGSKAEVAHPFGYNRDIISQGYGFNESGQKRLRIYNKKAYIEASMSSTSYFETLVTGLDPTTVNKDKYGSIGRTMVGTTSYGNNIIYFFVTGKEGGATQAEAISALHAFGCTNYIMFDGSGSSQMAWDGSMLVNCEDPGINRHVPVILRMDNR